jgi:hypothetical protein
MPVEEGADAVGRAIEHDLDIIFASGPWIAQAGAPMLLKERR